MKVKVEIELRESSVSEQREYMLSAAETFTDNTKSISIVTGKEQCIVAEFTIEQMSESEAVDIIATEFTDYLGEYENMSILFPGGGRG